MMKNKKIEYISTTEAAKIAGTSKETIRNWIRDFRIGIKTGGRWKVDVKKLKSILDGNIYYENQGRPTKEKD